MKSPTLTLGNLRAFIQQHQDAPDDVPVAITIPLQYNCGYAPTEDAFDEHDAIEYKSINASHISFIGHELNKGGSASSDGYISPNEQEEGEEWVFHVDIVVRQEEAHNSFAGCECEVAE